MKQTSIPVFSPHELTEEELTCAVGQLIIAGFPEAPEVAPAYIRDALSGGIIGGVILFRRNIAEVDQVVSLVESIHQAPVGALPGERGLVPWVAVDQEGGRVTRLREPLTAIPAMRTLGNLGQLGKIADLSEVLATELAALGFNLNFAPVLDVDTNPDNPVIGDRAFSSDPWRVAHAAGAFMLGHLTAGVVPCGKHFPGHGDTLADSHHELPVVRHERGRLNEVELLPFIKAVEASFPMIMTAHTLVPALDRVYPSTLSHATIKGLLRDQMGYQGVVVSDCLEMKAVADLYEIEEMVELGIRAGVDLFLICHTESKWRRAHAHLLEMARTNDLDRFRIVSAANRIARLKDIMLGSIAAPWKRAENWRSILGSPEHQKIVADIVALCQEDPSQETLSKPLQDRSFDPTEH